MKWESVEGCIDKGVATLKCVPALFSNVVEALLLLSGLVAVVMLIFAGMRFITGNADPKKIEQAVHMAAYTIIGLVIILFAFFIINVIAYTTGAGCVGFESQLPFFSFGKCK